MDEITINYKELMDNLFDGVYFVDESRSIRYWNKAAENITGYKADEVLGRHCSDDILFHYDDEGHNIFAELSPLEKSIKDDVPFEAELYLQHKNGRKVPVAIRITPIKDPGGAVKGAVELFSDISSKSATLLRIQELEKLSMTDSLTRVANRRYIQAELQNRLHELSRFNWPFGILFMDIDHFKSVNDQHGHDVGDAVLKMVADTVVSNVRPFDIFGRWGGEEFISIMRNVDITHLNHIGSRLRLLVETSFVIVADTELNVTISLGGTMARPDDTVETLVKRADQLMFKSKAAGRNCLTVSD